MPCARAKKHVVSVSVEVCCHQSKVRLCHVDERLAKVCICSVLTEFLSLVGPLQPMQPVTSVTAAVQASASHLH